MMKQSMFFIALSCLLISTGVSFSEPQAAAPATYDEPFRPQFHFSPPKNFHNDPNGLVFFDGEYHLFYQYNPFGDRWGHMSWGHAVSRDLVHWEDLPVALREEDGLMIFSGSAVIDVNDTTGFRKGAPYPAMVAIYTANRVSDGRQMQCLAYSTDRGRTWTKYGDNPVIDIGSRDFRDPKVFWHAPTKQWVMVVALAAEKRCRFYGSPDLKHWTVLSEFGPAGAKGTPNWECPDLFELPIVGEPGQTRWVLHINIGGGSAAGGSGGQYFVGRFDGKTFTDDNPLDQVLFSDFGKDFYAAVSWNDAVTKDNKRFWIGWMNDWQYANDVPTHPWRSQMSIPRAISLRRIGHELRLIQEPIANLNMLRGKEETLSAATLSAGKKVEAAIGGQCLELNATLDIGRANELGLIVREGSSEQTIISYDVKARQLFIDRSHSGKSDFNRGFASRQTAPLEADNGRIKLHVFVDRCSVEVFANDGQVTMTDLIFPAAQSTGVALYSKGGDAKVVSFEEWPMQSIWARN